MSVRVLHVLGEVRHWLPTQGPLEFFVHHNTLHAYEDQNFFEALKKARVRYEANVYKSVKDYYDHFKRGEIREDILDQEILKNLKGVKGFEQEALAIAKELIWSEESQNFIDLPLTAIENDETVKLLFFRELILEQFNLDIDDHISHFILNFFAAYFDNGQAYWTMPEREKGPLYVFKNYCQTSKTLSLGWNKKLTSYINQWINEDGQNIVLLCLNELKIEEQYWEDYLFSLAYRYKGWLALNNSLEENVLWNNNRLEIKPNFPELMAIIILCELSFLKREGEQELKEVRHIFPQARKMISFSKEFNSKKDALLSHLKYKSELVFMVSSQLEDLKRQYILHSAFESTFYEKFLAGFYAHQKGPKKAKEEKSFQVMCCIDDREESFRRYIEEVDPGAETFGIAGHFGLDITYKGIFDAHSRALCPNIILPSKNVQEQKVSQQDLRNLMEVYAELLWSQSIGTKSLVRGWIFQFFLGAFSFLPMSLSILSPHLSAKIRRKVWNSIYDKIKSKLVYKSTDIERGMNEEDLVNYAHNLLKTIGLTSHFAPYVFILGHGSSSLNNPHEAAYDCGACGGGKGAPNARLMAEILNTQMVRSALQTRGIDIPEKTVFIGGFHNTCNDDVLIFDAPEDAGVEFFKSVLKKAAAMDAKERCRRFDDVPLNISPDEAFSHVQGRAIDFSQARPEYCHSTNALCIVGPRDFSKNLFLDRRSFLVSYEYSQDPEGAVLKNIMSAVGPVCSGINLEYYFSYVDNQNFGCGTKLPHNVTSLMGVKNGYQSDLLLGLSWQMVEIHDPYRLMVMVVAEKNVVEDLVENLNSLKRLVHNQWIHLSVYDPISDSMYRFENGILRKLNFENLNVSHFSNSFSVFANQRQSCEISLIGESHVG